MAKPTLIIPYDPQFLGDGFVVPLPSLSDAARARALENGRVFDYTHYSLVMDRERRTAIYAANNIDAARKVQIGGGLTWKMDERVGGHQLGPETYDANQLDKGHLVRREDVLWGTVAEAREANRATYFYSNATPQHQNFNQDEWKMLEDWVLERATSMSYRLCVITGTVLRPDDPTLMDLPPELRVAIPPAQLPAAFWKVIVLRDGSAGGDDLAAVAFAIKQSETWNDRYGRRLLQLETRQVTLRAIEDWTGLDFGALHDVDELANSRISTRAASGADEVDAWPSIASGEDIVWSGPERRAQGLRAQRGVNGAGLRTVGNGVGGGGGCSFEEFDAKRAVTALSTQVAELIGQVAALEEQTATPGTGDTRSIDDSEGSIDAGAGSARGTVGVDGPRIGMDSGEGGADGGADADDPRVAEMVAAAPPELADRVARFARAVVYEGKVARREIPTPAARANLRIIGGDKVALGGFPTCVCVGIPSWGCTGVVVAPQIVLTAAHCGATIDQVMVGGESVKPLSANARVVAVRRAAIHPCYRRAPWHENDITVLILDALAKVVPMPLATTAQIAAAQAFDVVGFGYEDANATVGFGIKRHARISLEAIIARPDEDLGGLPATLGFHPDYEFVAGRKTLAIDSCKGDSGGPIYVLADGGYRLAGLTSRATRTAHATCGDGGIYVRPLMFLDFINQIAADAGVDPVPAPQ